MTGIVLNSFLNAFLFQGGRQFSASPFIVNEKGVETMSDEPCALAALHGFQEAGSKGFHLVPEYVETRSLYNEEKKGGSFHKHHLKETMCRFLRKIIFFSFSDMSLLLSRELFTEIKKPLLIY